MRHASQTDDVAHQIRETDADIWILAETDESIDLSATHSAYATPSVAGYHQRGEHWVTVWSRWGGNTVDTVDSRVSVCVDVPSPVGSLLVYGTVLPYHADRGPDRASRYWQQHYQAINSQGADWRRLRGGLDQRAVCLAGDLNQSRDGRGWPRRQWYGTREGRDLLGARLLDADLQCMTDVDFVEAGDLVHRSTVMHVCLTKELSSRVKDRRAWFKNDKSARPVSDHNGVHVDIAI